MTRTEGFGSLWWVALGSPQVLAGAARPFGAFVASLTLTLAADRIERGVAAGDDVEAVRHDPDIRSDGTDRLPVDL